MTIFGRELPPIRGGGRRMQVGRLKSRNQRLSGFSINNCCTVVCISHFAAGFLFTAGIRRPSAIDALRCTVRDRSSAVSRYTQSLWMRIVCMTARLDVTPKTTEHNLIVRTGKSKAEVTNNNFKKKLRCRYCTVEANY